MIRLAGLWKKFRDDGSSYLEGTLGSGKLYVTEKGGRPTTEKDEL